MGRPADPVPRWVKIWMWVTMVTFFMDGLFCVLRPHTLPDGFLAPFFYMHHIYMKFDSHYADTSDSFVFAIGIGSMIEATIHLAVLLDVLKNPVRTKLLAIIVNVMVCWKTCLFDLYSLDIPTGGYKSIGLLQFLIVYVTSLAWIYFPGAAAYTLVKDFLEPSSKHK